MAIWFSSKKRGVTLIEVLIGIAMVAGFSISMYQVTAALIRLNAREAVITEETSIADEQLEIDRNLAYANIGVVGGIPNGVIPATQNITRNGRTFVVTTTARSIDDPFDGLVTGTPKDSAPADYKLVQVTVGCPSCYNSPSMWLATTISPNGLEIGTGNGALIIHVVDASAHPVSGATVHIINSAITPAIDVTDTSDSSGQLQLVDVPPSVTNYQISVSKTGYSSDGTVTASVQNPNPVKPPATVSAGTVTSITFAIDLVSTLNVNSMNTFCSPLGSVALNVKGSKLVGNNPSVYKYAEDTTTSGGGSLNRTLEWDTYSLTMTDNRYALVGTVGTLPVNLLPNSTQNISLVLEPPTSHGLHVTVTDAATHLPITGASVRAQAAGYDTTLITGRGYLTQTDWSGGAGQASYTDATKYQSDDGNTDVTTAGQVQLRTGVGGYMASGTLTSSTFDTGGSSNFVALSWSPISQPASAGTDSVKFQLATNNDNSTWNYLGPDGTASTYYSSSNATISAAHNGTRYFRYRLYLSTADPAVSPLVSDVSVSFTSGCVPPGQVFFKDLTNTNYTIDITAAGYLADDEALSVNGWTDLAVQLTSQ